MCFLAPVHSPLSISTVNPTLADEETEAQNSTGICPKSLGHKVHECTWYQEPGPLPGLLGTD